MYIQTYMELIWKKTNLFNGLLGFNQTVLENEKHFIEISV